MNVLQLNYSTPLINGCCTVVDVILLTEGRHSITTCQAIGDISLLKLALPTKNIKVINSFYKGMHDMQRCLRLQY